MLKDLTLAACASLIVPGLCGVTRAAEPIDIGARRELFVDRALVEMMQGAELELHHPVEREVAIVHDAAWEGNNCAYHTVIQDGDEYRMYYRGRQLNWKDGSVSFPHEVVCVATSKDGIHWEKPNLGLVEFNGSKENNIILPRGKGSHNFAPFIDQNPECKPDERYKALGSMSGGLVAFKSRDGIHWSLLSEEPVITKGAFDSQNLAFWDTTREEYREYHRAFRKGRDIMTGTSRNFLEWTDPVWVAYQPGRTTQLYTNQIVPYYRAPHIFLGFPARYVDGRDLLTPLNKAIAEVSRRFGTDYTDTGLIASRDGHDFHVWTEAFVRPGLTKKGRWAYGNMYQAWGIVETESSIKDAPPELSFYLTEGCWTDRKMEMRRYTLRIDGFVSVSAPMAGGELVTKPLKFSGKELALNFSTSAAGSVQVEIQDAAGKPIDGYALADCEDVFGDSLDRVVSWTGGQDVSELSGTPVRLRFVLKDADLYSLQFKNP